MKLNIKVVLAHYTFVFMALSLNSHSCFCSVTFKGFLDGMQYKEGF